MAIAFASVPAAAQLTSSTQFLEAVKKRDGAKASEFVTQAGSTVINARDYQDGSGALHYMVRERDLTWLSFLLGKGANVDLQNNDGNTPLALAAQVAWVEGAQLLLRRKAAVDLPNSGGETPLIHAVHRRDLAMVRLLLNAGANPRRTDSKAGYSALDYAKQDRRAAAIVKILEAGAEKPLREAAGPVL
ncbi:MAG TPA: ankyrin repeat domain-containing protein [Allosphingosinicella sp.]|nr:ankyrin repeat domain-containing protein [Allosphingosinicella sp.]